MQNNFLNLFTFRNNTNFEVFYKKMFRKILNSQGDEVDKILHYEKPRDV
jgi:hypothetical protein